MDPNSPVITDALRLLRDDLYERLDQADEMALQYDNATSGPSRTRTRPAR